MTKILLVLGIVIGVCVAMIMQFGGLSSMSLLPGAPMPLQNTDWIMRKHLNLSFGPSLPQQLDLYLPNTGVGPFPVIVSLHGGGFMVGDKADGQLNPMLEGVRRGYAVASVNYRMSGDASFPAAVQDVKAAIRYLRAHADQYNLDPRRFAAWGGSAGGNLAAILGTSDGATLFEDPSLGNMDQSSAVQCVVDWFGPIDFLAMDRQFQASGNGLANHNDADSPESRYLGKILPQAIDAAWAANPARYISPKTPPFLIQHGDIDQNVPTQQSIDFANLLTKTIGADKVHLTIIKGARHGGPQFETPENLEQVYSFLNMSLK
jgi:acetyl esterase/lipase